MGRELELSFSPDEHARLPLLSSSTCGEKDLFPAIRRVAGASVSNDVSFSILKKSVDARKKKNIRINYRILLSDRPPESPATLPPPAKRDNGRHPPPVVVGFGPAGMFAALTLANNGIPPIIIERGRPVEQRAEDVEHHFSGGPLLPHSNVQFGEGGAGTFSDGKLYSGVSDGRRAQVLETFVACGAPSEIRYLAHPHIGTDRLRQTVITIRKEIIERGGRFLFERTVDDIVYDGGRLRGVHHASSTDPNDREFLETGRIILAIGHSARDTYTMLDRLGISLQLKPFSVGVRIEHLQESINRAQYGPFARHGELPPAPYRLVSRTANGKSLYTFCMCPGGFVVAGASQPGQVVTNGMSNYRRDGRNANSALLVGVDSRDFSGTDPLAGMRFQETLEHAAFTAGGSNGNAPCQRLGDFFADRPSNGHGKVVPTYRPGVTFTNLRPLLPKAIAAAVHEGITGMARKLHGFAHPDSMLTGIETRSSAPVRILRNEHLCSPEIDGLYPCGEGAGYAGGIMSSAIDGIRCAERILEML